MASVSPPVAVLCYTQTSPRTRRNHPNSSRKNLSSQTKQKPSKNGGGLGNIVEVVQKDVEFLKAGFSKGMQWANKAFRIPEVSKSVEDLIWLRNIEDSRATSFRFPSWPQPYYAELSGVDLFLADLKAMEVYASYFYYLTKMWTKPLPEMYDADVVTEYFTLRPHVVALRLLEVFTAFASATIKFRISRIGSEGEDDARESISDYNFGIVLKETMLNLGPTFIKVGQSLSTRPDIIGHEVSKALSELNDQIPPFPRAEAMKIIEEELGSPMHAYFSYISEKPVAAASFGQVYKATTHDGFDVAVKVQRPNLRHVVVRDIYILRIGLGLLQKIAKRKSDLRLYADELGKGLIGELDYNLEAANAFEFREVHSRFTFISVPQVFRHLSKKRVLTMEWMAGDSPSELMSVSSEESNRKLLDLVNKGVEASLIQLLETGLMHADPHSGNLRYTSSGKIGFLDFGLLCRMEKKHQFAMLSSVVHIVNGDWASLVHDLTEMDVVRPGTNIRRFTMDLEDALGEVEFKNGMPDVKFSRLVVNRGSARGPDILEMGLFGEREETSGKKIDETLKVFDFESIVADQELSEEKKGTRCTHLTVLGNIWSVALKYHCRMPPYYVLVLRSLASLEGFAVAADPTFKTFEAAYPYVLQKLLVDNSAATRRILHSVVFNRRREFQWQKLAVFLRIGATRTGLQSLMPLNTRAQSAAGVAPEVNLANLALKLLPSRNGLVLRRLIMTADAVSLIRALASHEASPFRKQLSKIIADILYKWMSKALESKLSSQVIVASGTNHEYESILRDRRLRVIFFKSLNSARKDPIVLLRFCWASFTVLFVASAMACRAVLATLVASYWSRLLYSSKKIAATV